MESTKDAKDGGPQGDLRLIILVHDTGMTTLMISIMKYQRSAFSSFLNKKEGQMHEVSHFRVFWIWRFFRRPPWCGSELVHFFLLLGVFLLDEFVDEFFDELMSSYAFSCVSRSANVGGSVW